MGVALMRINSRPYKHKDLQQLIDIHNNAGKDTDKKHDSNYQLQSIRTKLEVRAEMAARRLNPLDWVNV